MSVIKYKVSTSKRIGILFLDRLAFPVYSCIFFQQIKSQSLLPEKYLKATMKKKAPMKKPSKKGKKISQAKSANHRRHKLVKAGKLKPKSQPRYISNQVRHDLHLRLQLIIVKKIRFLDYLVNKTIRSNLFDFREKRTTGQTNKSI